MHAEISRFLRQLTVVTDDAQLIDEVDSILGSHAALFSYVKHSGSILTSQKYEGVSADGVQREVNLHVPDELHKPPSLSGITFTSTRTAAGICFTPKVNYIPLFDVAEFLRREKPSDPGSVEGIDHRIVTQLLLTAGYQSRVGSIWKQSAAMVAVGTAFLPLDHPSLAYYRLLLAPFADPPFYERGEGLVWVSSTPVNSVLPLLLHGAGQLVILSLLGVLAPIDCLACIQHWMTCLPTGFQDTKLATQKALRNWLPIALSQLPPQKVPVWSLVGDLTG